MPSQNLSIGGTCAPSFIIIFFFVLLFLGINGAIARSYQRGEVELLFFLFFVLLLLGTSGRHCQTLVEGEFWLPSFFFSFNDVFFPSLLLPVCFFVLWFL